MCHVVGLMVEMVGMGGMWCLFAIPVVVTLVRCGVASTFGLGAGRVAKDPTGMGLGGRSF